MLSLPDSRLALSVFAESHVIGRRIALIGTDVAALGVALADAGARLIHVYDRSVLSPEAQSTALTIYPIPDGPFEVRRGAFDVVLVPELEAHAYTGNLGAFFAEIRRILGDDGIAFIGAPASGPVGYDEFYDKLLLQFEHIRMFAEVPFRGVVLAELGLDDPAVTVDHSAAPPGAPDVFLAVASAREVDLESYAIIAVPETASQPAAVRQVEVPRRAPAAHVAADAMADDIRRLEAAHATSLTHERDAARRAAADATAAAATATATAAGLAAAAGLVAADRAAAAVAAVAAAAVAAEVAEGQRATARQNEARIADAQQRESASAAQNSELHLRVKYLESELEREQSLVLELLPAKEEARRARALETELARATDVARAAEHRAKESLLQADRLAQEAERLATEVDRLSADLSMRPVHDAQALANELTAGLTAGLTAELTAELTAAFDVQAQAREQAFAAERARFQQQAQQNFAEVQERAHFDAELRIEETLAGVSALEQEWSKRESDGELRYEAMLVERAGVIKSLERDVKNAERLVHELLLRLAETQDVTAAADQAAQSPALGATQAADLQDSLNALALELARREAELEVRSWTQS